MMHSTLSPELLAGTHLSGVDTTPLKEMAEDCCGVYDRIYLIKPIYEKGADRAVTSSGVAFKSCCAGTATTDAYLRWMPHLDGAIGFATLDVTDSAP